MALYSDYPDLFAGGSIDDVYSLVPMFINKRCLLGDLYLFDNRYLKALFHYPVEKRILGRSRNRNGENRMAAFRPIQRLSGITCRKHHSGI